MRTPFPLLLLEALTLTPSNPVSQAAYLAFQLVLAPLYVFSVLFTLNSRENEEERRSFEDRAQNSTFILVRLTHSPSPYPETEQKAVLSPQGDANEVLATSMILRDVGGKLSGRDPGPTDAELARVGTSSEERWLRHGARSHHAGKV